MNRAWGLSLRKCFCRRFNFELQAAALEDSIILSLGAVHSFALEEVKRYLSSQSVRRVLEQAVLGAPIFPTYWRWNASIGLAVRRFRNGRKTPAQLQRMDAEDLLSTVFPEQLACAENLPGGDLEIPDHPLIQQTLADCLGVAMDVGRLEAVLNRIETNDLEVRCRDLTSPSPLAQEILGARPYAFLDDAPAEERRTLAVQSRRYLGVEQAAELGRLDPDAIERVRVEAWPDAANADELHDALVLLGFMTADEGVGNARSCRDMSVHFRTLTEGGRATVFTPPASEPLWVSTERVNELRLVFPDGVQMHTVIDLPSKIGDREAALRELCRSRLEALGPSSMEQLGRPLSLGEDAMLIPLLALEQQGVAMRGAYTSAEADEWCERGLLARIHRYTLKRLRSEIEPVAVADYQRFLFHWQGLGDDQREGRDALYGVLSELQGLAVPVVVWERQVLPARIADYDPSMLDELSAAGAIVWWRPTTAGKSGTRPSNTVAASPICIVPRTDLGHWQALADGASVQSLDEPSAPASRVHAVLAEGGALFFVDIVEASGLLRVQVEDALGELVARGLVTSDAFNGLRAVVTPQRNRPTFHGRRRLRHGGASFDRAGRWALVRQRSTEDLAAARAAAVEHAGRMLLRRYGVVSRAVLVREVLAPSWRELVGLYRRWEARGEIRGGRFVEPLGGEQFALADAVTSMRKTRRNRDDEEWVVISATDPLNLAAVNGTSKTVTAIGANRLVYRNGVPVAAALGMQVESFASLDASAAQRVRSLLQPFSGSGRSRQGYGLSSRSRVR